jgi:uncharacterized protein YjbJ (UPF0337 family)
VRTAGRTASNDQSIEEAVVSFTDKVKNKAENAVGVAKEKTGAATGDRELQAEGKAEQSKASLKDAGEKLKDAAGNVKDAFGGSKG